MWQFLGESLTVSLIGAMLGIGLGAVGVQMFSKRLEAMPDVSVFLTSIGLAITIGILLGVISGLLPARRAGMMDTVDAMKFE
jgi:putative ABC transport system permease protein